MREEKVFKVEEFHFGTDNYHGNATFVDGEVVDVYMVRHSDSMRFSWTAALLAYAGTNPYRFEAFVRFARIYGKRKVFYMGYEVFIEKYFPVDEWLEYEEDEYEWA